MHGLPVHIFNFHLFMSFVLFLCYWLQMSFRHAWRICSDVISVPLHVEVIGTWWSSMFCPGGYPVCTWEEWPSLWTEGSASSVQTSWSWVSSLEQMNQWPFGHSQKCTTNVGAVSQFGQSVCPGHCNLTKAVIVLWASFNLILSEVFWTHPL
jgi:hypothetical protein